jgi:hypothetical protein
LVKYTTEEEIQLNKKLLKWQNRAKGLILSNNYDSVKLSEMQYSVLKQITNAESHRDVNSYLWNSGMVDRVLDYISDKLKSM